MENAVLTKEVLNPGPKDKYLLITSGWHMPRSMGVFRQAGFNVTAWPVDFHTTGSDDLDRWFAFIPYGLATLDIATKQWIDCSSTGLWGGPTPCFLHHSPRSYCFVRQRAQAERRYWPHGFPYSQSVCS